MSSEDFKSLIVTDPDLVDEGIDVSGLRTTTDTSPFLLGNIPDYSGIQYSTLAPTKYTDLMRLYSQGLPMFDTAQIPGAVDTLVDVGSGDGGGGATLPGFDDPTPEPINTPEQQRLIDEGIGVQLEPGSPVSSPYEGMPPTQEEIDAFNQIPVNTDYTSPTSDPFLASGAAGGANLPSTSPQEGFLASGAAGGANLPTDTGIMVEDFSEPFDDFLGRTGERVSYPGDQSGIISDAVDPQSVKTILGPDGITYDAVTGQPIDFSAPGTLSDPLEKMDVVTEQDLIDDTSLLQRLGLPADFDLKQAAIEAGINLVTGVPITLIARGLEAVLPDGIAPSTNLARETGLLQGDNTVTQDIYGINTQTSFDPVKSTQNYTDYNVKQVAKLENVLDDLKTGKYKDDPQAYLDNTKRLRQELEDRKEFVTRSGVGGDIQETGDASIAEQIAEADRLGISGDIGVEGEDEGRFIDDTTPTGVNPFANIDTGVGEFDTTPVTDPDTTTVLGKEGIDKFDDAETDVDISQDALTTVDDFDDFEVSGEAAPSTGGTASDSFFDAVDNAAAEAAAAQAAAEAAAAQAAANQESYRGGGDGGGGGGNVGGTGTAAAKDTSQGQTGYGSCFIAGTKVTMADGTLKNIEEIVVGDTVKGQKEENTVIKLDPTLLGDRKLYSFNNKHYFFTSEHPFMTEEGWKSIKPEKTKERDGAELYEQLKGELKVGDRLVTDNNSIEITSIDSKEMNNPEMPLYNFNVSNDNSYIADGYVVHNKGGGGGGGKIVCTMMNESYGFGSFRNKIWLKHSKDMAPEYQKGYHKIFLPLVKIAKTNKVVKKVLEHIAVHRTIDIRQESRGKVHLLGRLYRKILEPICYIVGKYAK
jgi:hypothetical protein